MSKPEEKTKNAPKPKRKYTKSIFDKNTIEQIDQFRGNNKNKKIKTVHEKSEKISNPRSVTINEEKKEALGINQNLNNEMQAASQLLVLPKNQTKESLSLIKPSDIGDMYDDLGNDTCRELYRINMDLHRKRNVHEFPMEELISARILTPYIMSLDEKQNAMAKQCQVDVHFVADQFIQLHHSHNDDDTSRKNHINNKLIKEQNSNVLDLLSGEKEEEVKKKRRKRNKNEGLATIKLKPVFNHFEYSFAYESTDNMINRNYLTQQHVEDWKARFKSAYLYDELDYETGFGLAPKRYKMFRQLVATNMEKYKQRDQLLKEDIKSVPLIELEEISREYITFYRQKPSSLDVQLCFNGQSCQFYTFSHDPLVRYIGMSFYTERQLDQRKKGIPLTHNQEGFCIDCLLKSWTLQHANNIARGYQPKCAFNHFTVIVGEGQYNQDCMLQPYYNRRLTGIMGHVPKYDRNQREVVMVSKRILDKKNTESGSNGIIRDNYIGEAGMDF